MSRTRAIASSSAARAAAGSRSASCSRSRIVSCSASSRRNPQRPSNSRPDSSVGAGATSALSCATTVAPNRGLSATTVHSRASASASSSATPYAPSGRSEGGPPTIATTVAAARPAMRR